MTFLKFKRVNKKNHWEKSGRTMLSRNFLKKIFLNIHTLSTVVVLSLFICQGVSWADKITVDAEYKLWRDVLSHLIEIKSNIKIIEAKVVEGDAFEVTKSFLGDLKVGQRLLFRDCDQIHMTGSTENYLRDLIRSPLVDIPVYEGDTLELPQAIQSKSYPPPDTSDFFIMILGRFDRTHWSFTRQTYGDFFLIHHKKIFRVTGNSMRRLWMPLVPEQSYSEFVKLLKQEIKRRQKL